MTRVAVVSTVRAPLHEARMFINYHLNMGIDEIILFFDDPLDEGVTVFTQLKQVSTVACTPQYWSKMSGNKPTAIEDRQVINANEGVRFARKKKCDWIVHIDSDELISTSTSIKSVLAKCDADALRFEVMEAVSERESYDNIYAATLFKKKSGKTALQIAKLLGCTRSVFEDEYFRSHLDSKMATKISSKFGMIDIHGPKDYNKDFRIKNTSEIALLHYDCVGFDSWNTKWSRRLDGSGIARDMRNNRVKQYQAYIQAKQKNNKELSDLYKHLHIIPKREKATLFFLGMLTRVVLDQSLFAPPQH